MLFSAETGKVIAVNGWKLHHRHPHGLRFGYGNQALANRETPVLEFWAPAFRPEHTFRRCAA